jgi:general secretion pathway protein F
MWPTLPIFGHVVAQALKKAVIPAHLCHNPPMRPRHFSPLPYQHRADLFLHLATLEKAGVPPSKAWAIVRLPLPFQERVDQTRRLIARGQPVDQAGLNSGLLTPLEGSLLKAALAAGDPSPSYARLAGYYSQKALQWKQIKSRMMMPLLTWLISMLVGPLPALVSGSLTPLMYVLAIVRSLSLSVLAVALGMWVHSRWQMAGVSSVRDRVDAWLLRVPFFGDMHRRRNVCDFWQSLALLLEAGMPMFEALPLALETTNNGLIRREWAKILPRMQEGATLERALAGIRYLASDNLLPLVATGEGSGTLPEMLERYARFESASLAQSQQTLAQWLPRIVYAVIAGSIAWSILVGPGIGPQMPDELK